SIVKLQTEFGSQLVNFRHRINADAIGDKTGRVFAQYSTFSEINVAVFHKKVNYLRRSFGCGNHFEQAQIARRIEKMRAAKMFFKILASAFEHQVDWNAGSVGTHQRAGFPV